MASAQIKRIKTVLSNNYGADLISLFIRNLHQDRSMNLADAKRISLMTMTAHMHRRSVESIGKPTLSREEFLQNFITEWAEMVKLDGNAAQLLANAIVT